MCVLMWLRLCVCVVLRFVGLILGACLFTAGVLQGLQLLCRAVLVLLACFGLQPSHSCLPAVIGVLQFLVDHGG
jgi:hypothetical protein